MGVSFISCRHGGSLEVVEACQGGTQMSLLLVAMLLTTQTLAADPLLRLEDDWAVGLTRRDAALFQRLLADGFVYTENDRTMSRDDVLRDIAAGSDTATTAHKEGTKIPCLRTTASLPARLVRRRH